MKRFTVRSITRALAFGALIALMAFGIGNAGATLDPITSPDASPTGSSTLATESTGGITPLGGGGGNVNNEVVVRNTVDGHFAQRAGLGIARVTGDVVENQNAAAATSSCSDCRTVAVAVQIVLIQRTDASVVSPRNLAIALNVGCQRCDTFAAAYQYAVTTDGLVRFTPGAQQQLAALESQIRSLTATDGVPFPDLEAQIDAVVEQMWAIVDQDLVQVGVRGTGQAFEDTDVALGDDGATPQPTSSPDGTASTGDPAREEEDGLGGDGDTSPAPRPSDSATPEPSPSSS